MAVAYTIKIGSQTISSDTNKNERLLLNATVKLASDGYGNRCELLLGDVNNTAPALNDAVTVEFDAGDGAKKIFTGSIDSVQITATEQRIIAFDALNAVARFHLESSYEDVNADFVVKDILSQTGATAGTIDTGVHLAALVLSKNTTALTHLLELARWCGAQVFSDGEGKVNVIPVTQTGSAHSFKYGLNLQAVELESVSPPYDSIEIMGEGAASSQGADKFYWLAKSLSGVSGKASMDDKGVVSGGSLGKKPRRLVLGALRSGEAAQQVAENIMALVASRCVQGRVLLMGAPEVQITDTISITDLPKDHSANSFVNSATLRVRHICHTLNRKQGLITEARF